jgi:CxxC-x17-CxxC domain-containing protein
MYTDRSLTCVECGLDFTFSADDQQYHAERGYQDPKRCPSCRASRRQSRGGDSYGSAGGGGGGGTYSRPQRQMFSATCARCGREAMVPFEPRGDRPVYCSDCFQPRTSRW